MMKIKYFIALVIISAGIVFAGASIPQGLSVRSDGTNIIISWSSISESNLKQYVVQRKSGNSDYVDIAWLNPRSDMNYEITDKEAYKSSGTWYKYRLKIVDNDGTESFLEQSGIVSHNVSSVKRTWGSIKALFR
ncbi:MAG: hypothetical protein WC061_08260 [Melioribacteraceae bacterium]